jgi:NOL1/NOP2/fmu family ribosome biogenesis protein
MNIHFIKSSEKRKITRLLSDQFGITSLPYLLIVSGKEKIRGFSGHLSKEEILQLTQLTNVEIIGLYMFKKEHENDIRLTIDATHLLKDQISKNILNINESQKEDWLRGKNLEISSIHGNVIIKHEADFIGTGKSNSQKIFNYIPKDRRLKN